LFINFGNKVIKQERRIIVLSVEINGKKYKVYEDGFLVDLDQWTEDWAKFCHENDPNRKGEELFTDEHLEVVSGLQEYYRKNGIAPMVRILSNVVGRSVGRIYELFPSGPGKGACKMAGIPRPSS
jgi:dissimilatory sulfite reductase related protein